MRTSFFLSLLLAILLAPSNQFCSVAAGGTIVEFNTSNGNFQVELFNLQKPVSVANFLTYVDSGTYSNSIVHRNLQGAIVQGGGFDTLGNPLPTLLPIADEVGGISNLRGTIAYANAGPNTATRQWYINISDNTGLDSAYTVFGQVLGTGMSIVDQINNLPVVNASGGNPNGTFANLPIQNLAANPILGASNLVVVNSITTVPEPSAVLMLMTAAFGLFRWQSRKS